MQRLGESVVDLARPLERLIERRGGLGGKPDARALSQYLLRSRRGSLNNERREVQVGRRGGAFKQRLVRWVDTDLESFFFQR